MLCQEDVDVPYLKRFSEQDLQFTVHNLHGQISCLKSTLYNDLAQPVFQSDSNIPTLRLEAFWFEAFHSHLVLTV